MVDMCAILFLLLMFHLGMCDEEIEQEKAEVSPDYQNDGGYQIPKEVQESLISPVNGYKVSGSGSTYGAKSPQIGSQSNSYSSSGSNSYSSGYSAPISGYGSYGGSPGYGNSRNIYGTGNTYGNYRGYGSNGYGTKQPLGYNGYGSYGNGGYGSLSNTYTTRNYRPTAPVRQYTPYKPGQYQPTAPVRQYTPYKPGQYKPTAPARQYTPYKPGQYQPTALPRQYSSYTTRKYQPTTSARLYFPDDLLSAHNLEMQSGSSSVEHVRPVCTKKPRTIMNASIRCTLLTNTCKAVCKEGYQFPTGEKLLIVICDAGEWSLEKYEWSDKLSCEPICMPQCRNNGICIQPGQCSCPDNFVGPYCEHEKKLCLNKPPIPKNSKISCSSTTCTITCSRGHQFPDGSSITNMICKEGVWAPSRTELSTISDCQPTCTPPCQNSGVCLSYNVCQCPKDYRGKQCQYNVEVCSPKRMNFNGAYNCSGDNDALQCKLSCPSGVEVSGQFASVYRCNYENGYFEPTTIPECKYSADMEVVAGGGFARTSYNVKNIESGSSSSGSKRRKITRHRQIGAGYDIDDDEDDIIEKTITKTKITIHKGRKKYRKNDGEEEEEYSEYVDGDENGESSEQTLIAGTYSLYMAGNVTIRHRLPKPATCVTWNGNKVKTFDGLLYTRNLYCSHTLVQDSVDGTFSVQLRSCVNGSPQPCPHAIDILVANTKYSLDNTNGNVVLTKDKVPLSIPTVAIMGMRVTKSGLSYKISMDLVGLTMYWDGDRVLTIEATAGLFNRTAGLCGTLDQSIGNDFVSRDGTFHKLASSFVDSWQVQTSNEINDNCSHDQQQDESMELVCNDDIKSKAQTVCKRLLRNEKFADCLATLQEETMLDACISDYCYCNQANREECACNGITVFAKECLFQGVKLNPMWRDMEVCPIPCKNGRIYKSCGPSFEASCGSAVEDMIGNNCNEGCFCPNGTVQLDGDCVRREDCPCRLRGKKFAPGKHITKDCNTCKCEIGTWKCSDKTCGARCGAVGDPHYITFDGRHFDFMGKCSYYLLKRDNFSIEVENVACPGSISETLNLGSPVLDLPSCTKSVTINVLHNGKAKSIKLKQGRQVLIDGLEVSKLPLAIFDGLMRIRRASSIMTLVAFRDGLKVWWDSMTRVYVDAPPSYRGMTQGLCGTFDANQQNDYLTPEGDIESSVAAFVNKWRTKESCEFVNDESNVPHPCQANMENKEHALKMCAKLKGKIFEECHWSVDPDSYYEDCMYDMCACKGDAAACMCPIFAAYANECGQQGTIINWRHTINECAVKCPIGQIYEECSDKCFHSCADIETTTPCKTKCVDGCRCPNGQALDDNNECIPVGLCSCTYQGLTFNAGYKEVRPGRKHLELCTCSGAIWTCVEAKDPDKDRYPPANDIRSRCLVANHEVFTTCESSEPKTCKNMHNYQPSTTIECRPGCECHKGYVFDASVKRCVLPSECSCSHGSKSYTDGERIKSDCNTCICRSGNWECTDRPCPATCSAWGDSHFETYDGRDFDFQGACNYVLTKGAIDSNEAFTVTIQNVLCGSLGVTCSKSVTIAMLGQTHESITLNSDAAVPGSLMSKQETREIVTSGPLKSMSIHRAGVFVVIEVAGGIQLKWDRGTRVYVTLSSRWKGRVQGLCGDYNDDAQNDLKSPSSGLETSAMIFGESWKLDNFCPQPTDQIDACKEHPERKIWAEKKCGLLKSGVFAACHGEVSVDKYMKRCVYDACACDQGGDCHCLCTALAAYAHACTMKGVPIRWRTPDLCPMQCDPHCSEYKSCISACPLETCDSSLDQAKHQRMCVEDTCVEGCQLKPCAEGEIYQNGSYTNCVPKSLCRPVCIELNGKQYFEGDQTRSDQCQTCHCSKGKEVCIGVPCTLPSILPSHGPSYKMHDAQANCKSGWTEWINQDKLGNDVKVDKGNMKNGDIEPLPSDFLLKNFRNSAFCPHELMKKIECRTVDTHSGPKLLGEDVECSLEKGLIGVGSCHDYEIRVLCDCNDDIEVSTLPTLSEILSTSAPLILPFDPTPLQPIDVERHTQPPQVWPSPVTSAPIIWTTQSSIAIVPPLLSQPCDRNPATSHVEYPGDCKKFLHCTVTADGSWAYVEKECGPGTLFNPNAMVCDHILVVMQMKPNCGLITKKIDPLPIDEAKCPPGKVWSECAVPCGRACHFYGIYLIKSGLCTATHNSCEKGCVSVGSTVDCPNGQFWRDDKVCVNIGDCTCVSDDGTLVKPGAVYKESDCKLCQCIDNAYVCDTDTCKQKIDNIILRELPTTTEGYFGEINKKRRGPTEETTIQQPISISTVTPPANCDAEHLIPLIDGPIPLPDSAFNASSYLSATFKPHFSRLNAKATAQSSGSWSPEINDQMQYLQIAFERPQPIFGVIMRGNPIFDQYVTSFKILHSSNGIAFHYLVDETSQPQIFSGPIDSRTPVKSMFRIPIEAKVVRIYPLKWHGSIAIRTELLGCSLEKSNLTIQHHEEIQVRPICDDALGVSNGKLSPDQIKFSSTKGTVTPAIAADALKLTATQGWQPNIDSPNEYVLFDFREPRNVTGIETKGGKHGWVVAYNILFSNDFVVWNTLQNDDRSSKLFFGNVDAETSKVNYFKYPIQTKALKLVPVKWNECIELKAEPIGCFLPYPVPTTIQPIVEIETSPAECGICPNILNSASPIEGTCRCYAPLYWNGAECVAKNTCPCTVGHLTYGVGAVFEKDDCSSCVCVLGGIAQCTPQKCPPCGEGLRRSMQSSCLCSCEPCPDTQKLCPSSGACISAASWCDGIQDCPDDELNCVYGGQVSSQIIKRVRQKEIIERICPDPKCPPGFSLKFIEKKQRKASAMLQTSGEQTEMYQKPNSKRKNRKNRNMWSNDVDECQEFECIPEKRMVATTQFERIQCAEPSCPDGYEVSVDMYSSLGQCAKYKCDPKLQSDAVCNVTGRTFNTFDGIEYKYDVCDHILARDVHTKNWTVSMKKNCSAGNFICTKEVIINDILGGVKIVLHTDLTLQLDGYYFTVDQLQKSPYIKMKTFVLSKVGNSIIFVSHSQHFWVLLDTIGDVKIGISTKYATKVDGLCGFFNENPFDDKRMPNGTNVLSTVDFGDSWLNDGASIGHCTPHVCSQEIQDVAWKMCESIKDDVFAPCAKAISVDHVLSRCLETACDCLKTSGTTQLDEHKKSTCKCSILQSFVAECMAADESIHLDTWRSRHECLAMCTAPLVHNDCYRRRCDPSCDTLNENDCPHLPGTCFSGCYCPDGTVRSGEKCVPVNECKDCICDGFGRSQFITFDRQNFTFTGNCTYLLTRDLLTPNEHKFQIYVSLGECEGKSCAKALQVLYGEHIIRLDQSAGIKVLLDDIEVKQLPYESNWITIGKKSDQSINVNLMDSQLEIVAMLKDLSFSIRLPSIKYGSKLEGWCADCNGDTDNDLQPNPKYTKKVNSERLNDILQTWQSDEARLADEQYCKVNEEKEKCVSLPPTQDPCQAILDQNLFGKCHLVIDPAMYVSMCQADMCKTGPVPKIACSHLAAYARECSRNGICIDWKRNECDDRQQCSNEMEYRTCGCHKTCETLTEKCAEPIEGCFCRDGKVLNNGKCIPSRECTPCDDKGHFAGDKWYPDKCSECQCGLNGQTHCVNKQCTASGAVCQMGFKQIVVESVGECCPTYKCVPDEMECAEMSMPICGVNQFNKVFVDESNCTKYVCECIPTEQCVPNVIRDLRPGEKIVQETSSCCPTSKIICDRSTCPVKPLLCEHDFYEVVHKQNQVNDVCCDEYECQPPQNVCIVDINGEKKLKNVDEIWLTKDPCLSKKCVYGAGGSLIAIDMQKSCPVNSCDIGFTLIIANGECCGECVQTKCVFNGTVYAPDSEWSDPSHCTTNKCLMQGKQLVINTAQPTCPDVTECPDEQKYFEDCCQRCRLKVEDKKTCLPISLGDSETIGIVEQVKGSHGKCINTKPIRGFTECHGTCDSGTKYNRLTLQQDKKCLCCSVERYEKIEVPVKCFDGIKLSIPISVPKSCSCTACERD